MTKTELRIAYRIKRRNVTEEQLENYSLQIANQLLQLDIWNFSFYHLFLTITEQHEVNTDYILNILSGKDKNIVLSKSDFKTGLLKHFLLTDNTTIKKNKYNIPEPVDGIEITNDKIEVVFVPLLAFDKNGNRVGYGKGFYDTFLASCKPETIKIGLSFFEAETRIISDIFEGDIALDYCVTPTEIYRF
ncbi:5-formyltetrahydrofolate cyclo-ligase [Lacinutrix sp. C3R15]|uniref:5-formyltetrahydrofolate cyclo-ligase n=1 Tax=Flavobacteriaceae TaxID=49546 RepID=UPI001C08B5DB|nr:MULTISPECIES: 5-formyltetrahydrofolate cyclo-ligase [Flavobacteriaceae]MBU2940900.1 5-formyltetrahydrofolate cyclo-ligase [Lacinutrix sp. C3R15]MDO6624219.1 5-formyltetrahydrofolate cyclo-ligase [Oceanihabitans sp. 1_MG-2023]